MLAAHDRNHDGYREGPQGFGGNGVEGPAKSGPNQRCHAEAGVGANYQMNWVARSLVMRRTYTIGLLLPEFTHPFFAEIARAVAQTARPHGYHLVISCFEEDPDLEASEADSLLARQVDGLIIASSQPPTCLDLFKRIRSGTYPTF